MKENADELLKEAEEQVMNISKNNKTHTDAIQVKKRWEYPKLVPMSDLEFIHKKLFINQKKMNYATKRGE